MKHDNDITTTDKFTTLLEEATLEGTIGVEEGKLVTNAIRLPQSYRHAIKNHLELVDKTYTPKTYTLFEELYEYTSSDPNEVKDN